MDSPYLMIDIAGLELSPEDKDLLQHPLIGGVILFTRNFESTEQLIHLTHDIHALNPRLMIATDQEGGRVQRFRDGFTLLPAMRTLGKQYDSSPEQALLEANRLGFTMASELLAVGIDCSFAPVADIDTGLSDVIGDRSFHASPLIIGKLAAAMTQGMKQAGLFTVGKHFPGHGHVTADSHTALPVDERSLEAIARTDLLPFKALIEAGVDGIMTAHIIYPNCDESPATFSPFWLKQQLRETLGFKGIIFSDDLLMAGASLTGDSSDIGLRVQKARAAGCDMLLICNNRKAVMTVIENIEKATIYEHS